jgi:outer membrane protein assembly factor BamB
MRQLQFGISRLFHHRPNRNARARRRRLELVVLLAFLSGAAVDTAGAAPSSQAQPAAWTVYHGNLAGTGVASSVASVTTSAPRWTSPVLDGQLYGEPLVFGDRVFVGTEDNTVYGLSATTGAVIWSTHLGAPVPASSLPCGDITPDVGITGTPVIDPTRSEIFVVADELIKGVSTHTLVGLSTTSGNVELTQDVDPPGANPAALLQRTGLTLADGQVVFGMGGNDGDCSTYRGRVVAENEAGGAPSYFTVDAAAGQSQGAVWMGGAAPAVDASGNIWVGVGNGSVSSASQPYDNSDSVLELSPSLKLLQFFAPSTWPQNNADDLDMSIAPALLSDGQVVLAGKSRIVYLLNGSDLGGIGGQEASLPSGCTDDIDGGTAVVGTTVFLPCVSGIVAVQATQSPAALTLLWNSRTGGGPPVVAAGLVWTIGQNGLLYGLDPSTGKVSQKASVGVPANHFPTPGVGDGLLVVAGATKLVAFATASATTSTTTSPSTTSTSGSPHRSVTSTRPHSGGIAPGVVAGIVAVVVVLLAGIGWGTRRRRRGRP